MVFSFFSLKENEKIIDKAESKTQIRFIYAKSADKADF
jgi:hypothetical protein